MHWLFTSKISTDFTYFYCDCEKGILCNENYEHSIMQLNKRSLDERLFGYFYRKRNV